MTTSMTAGTLPKEYEDLRDTVRRGRDRLRDSPRPD